MLFTENRHIVLLFGKILIHELFHFVPLENHSGTNSASDMAREGTVLVIALNHASAVSFKAFMACQIKPLQIDRSPNLISFLISKLNFRRPINANNVCPNTLRRINLLHHPLSLVATEALNLITLHHRILLQLHTSLAVPSTCWQPVQYVATVASLVNSSVAQLADSDLVVILVFELEANVALNVFVVVVLEDLYVVVWIGGTLLLFDVLFALFFGWLADFWDCALRDVWCDYLGLHYHGAVLVVHEGFTCHADWAGFTTWVLGSVWSNLGRFTGS